jgi:hypothetical protein
MFELPKLIIWPDAKERPKTLYLKHGFDELKIPIQKSKKWINKLKPRSNPRGPYVYPIEFIFSNKRGLALFDIGTVPKNFYPSLMGNNRLYFKIHMRPQDRKKYPNVFPAPNSTSRLEILKHLNYYRVISEAGIYYRDFFFSGWHDDDGTRMKCVKLAKSQKWKTEAGLQPFKHHTTVSDNLKIKRYDYIDHLNMQIYSKINLALPGGRSLPYCSFRHVELWAMGAFVLSYAPTCIMPGNPLECMGVFKHDCSNFIKTVDFYLKHDDIRKEIAMNGRKYFDKYLTPRAHAVYFIKIFNKYLLGKKI